MTKHQNNKGSAPYATLKIESDEYKLPIYRGSDGRKVIDISNLYSTSGICTFDPGFKSTASCTSKITRIDGENSILQHRGHSIEKLASENSYDEVSYLLLCGELPTESEFQEFCKKAAKYRVVDAKIAEFFKAFPKNAHPMAMLLCVVGSLSAFYHEQFDIYDKESRNKLCMHLIGKVPTIAAMTYKHKIGQAFVQPKENLSFADNFLHMMFSTKEKQYECTDQISKIFNQILILHADHEQNVSTSTVRVTGSSATNPFAAISAGISSLWGPLHGGANEAVVKMLEDIGSVDKVPDFLEQVKAKKVKLMGFGHRVYRNYDPRGTVFKKSCNELLDSIDINRNLFEIAQTLEEIALEDEYFSSRKLFPNIDFYSGLIYRALGIPIEMFTSIFAVARIVGWTAQWNEMIEDPQTKIARPRQLYQGLVDVDGL